MTGFEQILLYVVGVVGAIAFGILLTRPKPPPKSLDLSDNTMVFLIGDGRIIDANFQAKRVIEHAQSDQGEYERLQLFLSKHFDDASRILAFDTSEGDLMVQSYDGQLQAIKQITGQSIRVKILFVTDGAPSTIDMHTLHAIEDELQTLRANTSAAPFLLWRQKPDGEVVWVNNAYLDTAHRITDAQPGTWPLPVIFSVSGKGITAQNTRVSKNFSDQFAG